MTKPITNLDELYAAFSGLSMEGGWHRVQPALWPEPRENFLPAHWAYSEVRPILETAGALIDTEKAERRNLTMTNPVEGNLYPTVRTIVAAYQMIKPGERAYAHRHTPNALRLILEGRGAYTVVDGIQVEMRPGDVLLTPNWAWHSHENTGSDECYWMDFLDVPLVHLLEPMFFERHPDKLEAEVEDREEADGVFRWEDTVQRLAETPAGATPEADKSIELGSPALPTIGLHMQELKAGSRTGTLRTTANSIFAVVKGSGTSTVGGRTFDWGFGDTIAVPGWREYSHVASDDAVLLRVTDAPVMEKLGWLRNAFE